MPPLRGLITYTLISMLRLWHADLVNRIAYINFHVSERVLEPHLASRTMSNACDSIRNELDLWVSA